MASYKVAKTELFSKIRELDFTDFESSVPAMKEGQDFLQRQFPDVVAGEIKAGNWEYEPEDFDRLMKLGGGDEGAFSGTGMPAQVGNMLVQGVEDPEFRNTPEYARAYQLATQPRILRTPTGDIKLPPELPAIFKAPGFKSDEQQIQDSKDASAADVEIIPGTEKEIKTSADEKTSYGFYKRMSASEENIKALGSFDSASYWERFKGLTNITASPELQKYRQAADDWIRAKLRRESGAVIGVEEMQKEYEIYFPQLGDSQGVMDQKLASRVVAIESMKTAAGRLLKDGEKDGGPQKGAPVINEGDMSVTIDGITHKFPNIESFNNYRKAAGLLRHQGPESGAVVPDD